MAAAATECGLEMARVANSKSSGSPLKVLKQSANKYFSGYVIPVRCGLLANEVKISFLQADAALKMYIEVGNRNINLLCCCGECIQTNLDQCPNSFT